MEKDSAKMNRFSCRLPALAASAALGLASAAHAQITGIPSAVVPHFLGTSVTGNLQFNSFGPNYFNPANGSVPAGYLNKTQGITVTVAEPDIEFGYSDPNNTDTVNLTDTTITLTDVSGSSGLPFLVTLTDTAFNGLTLIKVSDTFTGGVSYTLNGNVLKLSVPGFGNPGTFTANFAPADRRHARNPAAWRCLPPYPPLGQASCAAAKNKGGFAFLSTHFAQV